MLRVLSAHRRSGRQNMSFLAAALTPADPAIEPQLYCMPRQAYVVQWQEIGKTTYGKFGRPISINLLWQRKG